MADADKNVRLVSVEGESYEVPLDVAKMSELVKNMIDDVSTHFFFELSSEIGLSNFTSFTDGRIKMKKRPKRFPFLM